MKNIHILPTSLPSRLGYLTKKGKEVFKDLRFFDRFMPTIMDGENQNIYITNDEEIKEGDWVLFTVNDITEIVKVTIINNNSFDSKEGFGYGLEYCKKIILTTDLELISDGVQKIDDEFLEWFVNNSSCEFVEVEKTMYMPFDGKVAFELSLDESLNTRPYYKLIIPKEEPKQDRTCTHNCSVVCGECQIFEPKQETLEEVYIKKEFSNNKPKENVFINTCFDKNAFMLVEHINNDSDEKEYGDVIGETQGYFIVKPHLRKEQNRWLKVDCKVLEYY